MRHQKRSSQPVPKTSPASASAKENPMQQSPVVAFMPYDKQSKRHTDITKAVTNFLAKDMMAFSTVENEGFRKRMLVENKNKKKPLF